MKKVKLSYRLYDNLCFVSRCLELLRSLLLDVEVVPQSSELMTLVDEQVELLSALVCEIEENVKK